MPALLMHMTLAKQVPNLPDAPSLLVRAATRQMDALLLGSVLPDLPYHAHFYTQLARHLAKKEYLLSEWGDLLHTRGTGQLALAFLRHLVRSKLPQTEQDRVLALVAGYLCHYAVDRVVHPVINQVVDRERKGCTEHPTVIHARIERYQSLLYHQDLLGYDIVCSPYPRKLISEMAGAGLLRPRLDRTLWRAIRAACIETHGRAPTPSDVIEWLRSTTTYGYLMASPLGRVERLKEDREVLKERFYDGPGTDIYHPLEQSLAQTATVWKAAEHVIQADRITGEVRDVFLHTVADVDLGTGA
jgi:hypothetical protein